MAELGKKGNPLKVAIVGAGPSGFYATDALINSNYNVVVDLIEKLPTPYGLVRSGVAPDHPKIKSSIQVFEKITDSKDFNFIGNVKLGEDVSIEELKKFYHAIILTVGAETDRSLGIPGEDIVGSHTATEFVGWYNGHPEHREKTFDLSHETAVIIGQGNVAADVARILSKTIDELKFTDISEHALNVLSESKIKKIYIVGRRGPAQGKFTSKELREFGELRDCNTIVDKSEIILNKASESELQDKKGRLQKKIYDLFVDYSKPVPVHRAREFPWTKPYIKKRNCYIQFLKSPVELKGNKKLEKIIFEKNSLSGDPFKQSAKGTGETYELDAGIIFRSIGYRGIALPGVPFHDSWGVIPNEAGRVMDNDVVVPRLYTAGWIKRGPSGIIGTNKACANETIEELLKDIKQLNSKKDKLGSKGLYRVLDKKGIRYINFNEWKKIDEVEVKNGQEKGKPREKFTYVEEMLAQLT